jgi:hypothetical protein
MTYDEEIRWLTENGFKRVMHLLSNDTFERKFDLVKVAFVEGLVEAKMIFKDQVILTVRRPVIGDIKDFLFEVLINAEDLMFACQEMSDELNAKHWPHRIEKE